MKQSLSITAMISLGILLALPFPVFAEDLSSSQVSCNTDSTDKDTAETRKICQQRAEQGDATAQCYVGRMYVLGTGVDRDDAEALKWYRLAAKQGFAEAQYKLGQLLVLNQDIQKSEKTQEPIMWFRKAAEQGFSDAQYELGMMYEIGKKEGYVSSGYVEHNDAESKKWYKLAAEGYIKAANKGNASAQYSLAGMYSSGNGVKQNLTESLKWYILAGEQGAGLEEVIRHELEENPEETAKAQVAAAKWKAERGDIKAQYRIGEMYAYGQSVDLDRVQALAWFRKAAERGYTDAQYKLGVIYDTQYDSDDYDRYDEDYGVERNNAEAAKWYRLAAEQGHVYAQYHLGRLNAEGRGVAKNDAEAAKWYIKAAEQGYADAQYQLGKMFAQGIGLAKDGTQAVKWFKKSGEQEHAGALRRLWEIYAEGQGVPKDTVEALNWLKKAAELEFPDSQYNLGIVYEEGRGVARNDAEAAKWFRLAAELGHAAAQNRLGRMYAIGRGVSLNDVKARGLFVQAAEQGDADSQNSLVEQIRNAAAKGDTEAQTILGLLYRDDGGFADYVFHSKAQGIKLDTVEAAKWFRKAAEQGFAPAQYYLGMLYYSAGFWGRGIEKDYAEALKWFLKAAEQENAAAQYFLMDMHIYGNGVKKNETEALKWLKKSAENGHVPAQYELGKRYVDGTGVASNHAEAAKWLEKAVKQGDENAVEILQFIKPNFSCDDISGKDIYEPVKMKGMIVCLKNQNKRDFCNPANRHFQYRPPKEEEKVRACLDQVWSKYPLDESPSAAVIYSITQGSQPVVAEGGVFAVKKGAWAESRIREAFLLDINGDGKDEFIVIHESSHDGTKSKKTTYPKPTSDSLSVIVFDQKETGLHRNKRASEWFGSDFARWYLDGNTVAFDFPYWSHESVEKALSSPYAPLLVRDAFIPATVRCKSHLYEHTALDTKSAKYLITGDKVTVDKHMAGWCRVNYSGGRKPLQMWMRCDELLEEGKSDSRKCPVPHTEEERKLLRMINFSS